MFIFERDRQTRQSVSRGEAEREWDTESEAGSRLRAVSTEPHAGLKSTNRKIMTWAEVGRLTDWATQAPQVIHGFLTAGGVSAPNPYFIQGSSVILNPYLV